MAEYELVLGDCIEYMRGMEDNSVDCVVTDPPYPDLQGGTEHLNGGVGRHYNHRVTVGDPWSASWDWLLEAWRVCRYGMMVFCSFNNLSDVRSYLPDEAVNRGLVVWYKRNSPNPVNNVPKYETEFIWLFQKAPGIAWRRLRTLYDIPNLAAGCFSTERILRRDSKQAAHPTQKPVKLMQALIEAVPVGGSVFDPYAGTGTTGVATVQSGRNFLGCEREPTYHAIARKRIAAAAAQPPLFATDPAPSPTQPDLFRR